MSQIFISYSSKDRPKTKILANILEKKGWSVWWDKNIPAGQAFDLAIGNALDQAKCVIVLWSKNSIMSDWVWEEASEGKDRKILVPVLLDKVRIPLGFRRIQTVNLEGWRGSASSAEFQKLLEAVETLVRQPAKVHRPPKQQATPIARVRKLTGGLDGKTIVFTGKLEETREAHAQKVKTVGANFVNSVSKNTDYLVVGAKPGANKLADAKKYGTKKISETEWLQLLNDTYKRILNGKQIVFTGTLTQNRKELEQLATKLGAKVSNSVSSKTNYLVIGSNPGASKIKAAKEHQVEIITEKIWTEIMNSL